MELATHIVCSGAIVYNEKGEILLSKIPRKGWEFPGGIIENGESIIDGIKREVLEETGINVKVKSVVAINSNIKSHSGFNGVKTVPTKVIIDFICEYISGEFKENDESLGIKWVKPEEALTMINKSIKERLIDAIDFKNEIIMKSYYKNEEGKIVIQSKDYVNK